MVTEGGGGCQEKLLTAKNAKERPLRTSRKIQPQFFPVAIPQNLWHAYVVIAQEG